METLNGLGYKLIEHLNNEWEIAGSLHKYSTIGPFKVVIKHAVTALGFKLEEIEYAIEEMIKNNHNTAHFGIYKNLIYTYNTEIKEIA